jgi:hypothetical protein
LPHTDFPPANRKREKIFTPLRYTHTLSYRHTKITSIFKSILHTFFLFSHCSWRPLSIWNATVKYIFYIYIYIYLLLFLLFSFCFWNWNWNP